MSESISFATEQSHMIDDDRLLVQAAQKNPAAFEELYRKWLKPVYRYFYARVQNPKDAEDLTSQVFMKVYQSLPGYNSHGCFSAWLFRIAHDRAVDFYRKSRQEMPLEYVNETGLQTDTLQATDVRLQYQEVMQLISSLPENEQEIIRLRFMAGLQYKQIGQILHKRDDAIRKTLTRLLRKLQLQLEVDHE